MLAIPKAPRGGTTGHLALALLLAAALVAGSARTVHAQDPERLRHEIEFTDRILERAREVVHESGNPRAVEQLKIAFRTQGVAKDAAGSRPPSLRSYLRALELTRSARTMAQRAINIASQQAHLEQQARQALDRLERAIAIAHEHTDGMPPPRLQRILDIVGRQLEQAREAFHEHRFQECINICKGAGRLLENFGPSHPRQRLEGLFDMIRNLLERAEDEVAHSGNEPALALLERARDLLGRSEENLSSGRPGLAERQLHEAREMILRAMRMTETLPDVAGVDRVLEETAVYVDEMARQVRDTGSSEAMTLMENALRHMDRAQEMRLNNKLRRALAEARVARNLARRAGQLAGIHEL
ncbi:MAG: hypothetical protein ACE5G2_06555 [Candidatus Krumholzibacteriia bacterium]